MGTLKTAPYWASMPIPGERNLRLVFDLYKPSKVVADMVSEAGRTMYGEIFTQIDPLYNLCVRALAQSYTPRQLGYISLIFEDTLKRRIYYDTLNVNVPLRYSYCIDDEAYWRRVAIAKCHGGAALLKNVVNWKEVALSLKFEEIIENTSAEFWPEENLSELIHNIKEVVKDLHIRQLQTVGEHSFTATSYNVHYDDTSDEESSSTEADKEAPNKMISNKTRTQSTKTPEWEIEERERSAAKTQDAYFRKITKNNRRKAEEERAKMVESSLPMQSSVAKSPPMSAKQLSKIKMQLTKRTHDTFKSVYKIPINALDEEELSSSPPIRDRRNPLLMFNERHRNSYPSDQCHHVPLGFIRHFRNLVSFAIEFKPPDLERSYHSRYFNLSNMDILHLAFGLRCLHNLKIFRMRNSRMNASKLYSLATSLELLPKLEVVDFGYDHLKDDCDETIPKLFNIQTLKSLELEGNSFGAAVLSKIAECIGTFSGRLEYLGLARGTFEFRAMRSLCAAMVQNNQVAHLSLAGASVSQKTIGLCIAHGIVKNSTVLKHLDMTAVRITQRAAAYLASAMKCNTKILKCDVRASDLPLDIERDIMLICKRNQYLANNTYVGKPVRAFGDIEQMQNPIFVRALESLRRHACDSDSFNVECAEYPSSLKTPQPSLRKDYKARRFAPAPGRASSATSEPGADASLLDLSYSTFWGSSIYSLVAGGSFDFEPNNFDLKSFGTHVRVPGPADRYEYFRSKADISLKEINKFNESQQKQ